MKRQQNKKSLFQLGSQASIEHTVDLFAASLRTLTGRVKPKPCAPWILSDQRQISNNIVTGPRRSIKKPVKMNQPVEPVAKASYR